MNNLLSINLNARNLKKIFLYSIFLCTSILLSGCHLYDVIQYMDVPIPDIDRYWYKKGVTNNSPALIECAQTTKFPSGNPNHDLHDICMLKKGFTYVAKPKGYLNVCRLKNRNNIGCQSYRREIIVIPDPEPLDLEGKEKSNNNLDGNWFTRLFQW